MPEGPEIRLAADQIELVLKGQVIEKIEFGLTRLAHYKDLLRSARVTNIETRGKALLTHFDNDHSIYSHNQLYGVWRVVKRDVYPKTNRQLRMALHTASHSAILYSASDISVWPTEELYAHPFLKKIGPDILNPDLTWRLVAERLKTKAFSNRALSSVYLDQAFLAGLGNYLRSEILFLAGVHPTTKASQLSRAELGKLARTTLAVSHQSYQLKGVTIPERQYKKLRAQGQSYGKARFYVFGRASQRCRICNSRIARTSLNTRRIYICPTCQPEYAPEAG